MRRYNYIQGAGDLFTDGLGRKIEPAHRHHVFNPRNGLAGIVGMYRAHGSVMTGVHRLQQVEGFRSAHLADDNPLGAHPEAVLDQITHGDLAHSLKVWRARFEPDHMRLLKLKFSRVLAGDGPFREVDEAGERVEERGLAGSRTARNQGVQPALPPKAFTIHLCSR